jgi:glucokinase
MDLIADIGGTHSRCALVNDKGKLIAVESFENHEFDGILEVFEHYLGRRRLSDRPTDVALAVAGPVGGDEVRMTNLPWRFSQAALEKELGANRLIVVNDFAAVAWALPTLLSDDLCKVGGGEPAARAPLVVLGPGSGLGIATLVPFNSNWAVVAGEGGNASIATSTPAEAAIVDSLRDPSGYCAAETVLSGPGLSRIYALMVERAGQEAATLLPAAISAAAAAGEPLAVAARNMFFGLLGGMAGDLALTAGARGGIYVAGGIVPRLLAAFLESDFRERFEAKGRYRSYLSAIPTYVITAPMPALLGLRKLLGYR